MGILTTENMLTESGNFLGFNELKQKETTLTMANYFLWLGIVHSLPCGMRRMIKAGNISSFSQPTLPRNFHSDQIHVKLDKNNVVKIQALTSKQIYKPREHYNQQARPSLQLSFPKTIGIGQISINYKFHSTRHLYENEMRITGSLSF